MYSLKEKILTSVIIIGMIGSIFFFNTIVKSILVICFGFISLALIRNNVNQIKKILGAQALKEKKDAKERNRINELEKSFQELEQEKEKASREIQQRVIIEKKMKSQMSRLEYMNEMMVDRESKMMDLKKEIGELKKKLKNRE